MKGSFSESAFLSATVAVIILSLLTGCGASRLEQKKSLTHIDMGKAYLESRQYAPALKELMIAENLTPGDPDIYYHKGVSYYGIGMREDAVREFRKAVALQPDYSEAHNYLGAIYTEKGLDTNALEEFNKALSNVLYETPSLPLNSMGDIYYKKGEYKTAMAKYEEAIQREPGTFLRPLVEKNIGRTSLAIGDTKKAIYHLQRVVEMSPYLAEARYWLGMSYLKDGNKKKATEELRSAMRVDPKAPFGVKAEKSLREIIGN